MANNDNIVFFDGSDEEDLHKGLTSFYSNQDTPKPNKTTSDFDSDDDSDFTDEDEDTTSVGKNPIDQTQKKPEETDDNEEPNELVTKFNTLRELGYLELPDDYTAPETEEDLEKAVETSKQYRQEQAVTALWESLPEQGKPLLEYLLNGGTDISKFQEVHSQFPNLDTIDLEDTESQKQIMKMYYIKKGFTESKANKQVEILDNLMELETEAREALIELKEIDKSDKEQLVKEAKEAVKRKEDNENKRWQILEQTIKTTDDFGGGYTIGKKDKPAAFNSLYKQVRTEDGTLTTDFNNRLRNIVLQDPKLTLVLSDILNKLTQDKKTGELYFDFSNIQEKAETKITKGLSDKLDRLADAGNKFKAGNTVTKSGGFNWETVL